MSAAQTLQAGSTPTSSRTLTTIDVASCRRLVGVGLAQDQEAGDATACPGCRSPGPRPGSHRLAAAIVPTLRSSRAWRAARLLASSVTCTPGDARSATRHCASACGWAATAHRAERGTAHEQAVTHRQRDFRAHPQLDSTSRSGRPPCLLEFSTGTIAHLRAPRFDLMKHVRDGCDRRSAPAELPRAARRQFPGPQATRSVCQPAGYLMSVKMVRTSSGPQRPAVGVHHPLEHARPRRGRVE